jgi:hypothetical protein
LPAMRAFDVFAPSTFSGVLTFDYTTCQSRLT